jgi:hypothetical protein
MQFPFSRLLPAIAACALCLCFALAAPAGAADSDLYPSDPNSRTFSGGPAGWTSSATFDGVCVPPLVCPRVDNRWVAGGDAGANGYISSDYLGVAGVGSVAGTSTGVWESPAFTFTGASKGEVAFSMRRRADVDELLAVAGNSAEYAVRLVNVTEGGTAQTVIAPTTMAAAADWSTVSSAAINASRLEAGDTYRLRIESIYKTGTGVLVTGSADYDNVVLGPGVGAAGGGDKGDGSGKGDSGSGGRDTLRSGELLSLFSSGLSERAVAIGAKKGKARRLMVKVRCPRRIGAACRVTAQGLLKKRKAATRKRTVKVGKGKSRRVVLAVKPRFRSKVAKRKRLLVSENVRAGKASATAYKIRKLIRR